MNASASKKGIWLGVAFRSFAVLFAAAGLLMLQGLSEGLEPWVRSFLASTPLEEGVRFHAAAHGALIGILFSFSLLAMLKEPLSKPLLLNFYIVGHLIFLATLSATDPALAKQSFFVFILFTVVLVVLYATYGGRREIFRPSEPKAMNRTLLLLTGIALLALSPFIVRGLIEQAGDGQMQFRWGEGAALGLTLLYAGYLTATSRTGARALGYLQALAYAYMGAASLTLPDYPGSWGLWGGLAAIAYGIVYGAVVRLQLAPRPATAAQGAVDTRTE
ncbi:hypothetical protein J19TS2_08720 [Cohnella xylanilytica]|uniref:hypothetical protein n=1 Tax=Cohnella xylanilytica TaxID=557555 RepID=UPI001AFDBD24|nr:hypothetical protein [Cohnella xylanilytica]GIO11317.1 hypothetical protein J19TS2_08720 [Cohnella xylanilytica]